MWRRGKTPVLQADRRRTLLDSINTDSGRRLRDRAIMDSVLHLRAGSAMVHMRVSIITRRNQPHWGVRLHDKGGKRHECRRITMPSVFSTPTLPLLHQGREKNRRSSAASTKHRPALRESHPRTDVAADGEAPCPRAGLPSSTSCTRSGRPGSRVPGERAVRLRTRRLRGARSPRTTKLYDRTGDDHAR